MDYNQITVTGTIAPGPNPPTMSAVDIKQAIFDALNKNDFTFRWTNQGSQPYRGILFNGENNIDVYLYAWNITPAYRDNDSEKRIQIRKSTNNVGIDRDITANEKTVILGVYNTPSGIPVFAAWDAIVNRGHGQKSCYVLIEDLARALTEGIFATKDKNNAPIYTMTGDFLGQYIDSLQPRNILSIAPTVPTTTFTPSTTTAVSLADRIKAGDLPKRKKRAVKSVEKIKDAIKGLSQTEREMAYKQRVGQGLFKELLLEKYNGKCALCAINTPNLLIGSHIKEWSQSSDEEKLDENNGLLLCAHHDALFDKHFISFNDDGTLIISPQLDASEQTSLSISAIPTLTVDEEMKPFLAHHRTKLRR